MVRRLVGGRFLDFNRSSTGPQPGSCPSLFERLAGVHRNSPVRDRATYRCALESRSTGRGEPGIGKPLVFLREPGRFRNFIQATRSHLPTGRVVLQSHCKEKVGKNGEADNFQCDRTDIVDFQQADNVGEMNFHPKVGTGKSTMFETYLLS